ncbi:hypothetical protein L5515_014374 [Caenorhabditis briggsae]|uniref:Transcription-associated protein 1 n=1 Tax=Caenorhabditis briggsae TaxID=6238 RepID=A0AAE9ED66_CAEBR|nr:hypothetical protein L5515_014374 [Caenorhabditis briggsae]
MDPSIPSTSHRSVPPDRGVQPDRNLHVQELENRIQSLVHGGQRDDVKLKELQDIWASLENHFTASSHEKVVEKLVLSILQLFCNTSPQFISENNTQMLRKLMLEILLRLSNTDPVKTHSKEILKQMMRLIGVENEENAILAIRILIDQGRYGKLDYCREVQSLLLLMRTMVKELAESGRTAEMFLVRELTVPPATSSEEQLIAEYLTKCYYAQPVILNAKDGLQGPKFNMIPSAHQSIKVLLEMPFLVIFFYQNFKTTVQTEALEFTRLCLDFLNVPVPADKTKYHDVLTDDFVTVQSKILSFVNIMAKIPAFMELLQQNGDSLVSGTMQMLERCPPDLISVRREVLLAVKYFTAGEMKSRFFTMLPRLISEHFILGTGFTAIELLRVFMYQMLADLMHHTRDTISYELISHVVFVFCRALHDPNNSAQVLIMSARLLNSLAESLCRMESQAPIRDLMLEILEAQVSKLKVMAVYHIPILFQQYGTEIEYEYRNYERESEKPKVNVMKESTQREVPKRRTRKLSMDSVEELEFLVTDNVNMTESEQKRNELPTPTKEHTKKTSPEAILNSLYAASTQPLGLSETRNLIKYVMHTCKYVTGQLKISRPSTEMYHCVRERDLYERLLRYGIMCMDIYVLPAVKNQAQAHASQRTKEEKEALESLANVFTSIDHAIFRELFEKYMDFLIERIYNRNYPLQLMVNTFLVRNEVPFFASTMLSFLMSRMKMLEVSSDKTALYVKLFKIIFSAIGANNSTIYQDRMLTNYLPEILKQSTVLALTAREPTNYFLLLRSLFRSIGGGAQDMLYGTFLQLLPNLLQFLNKLTSCQHRIQMREIFVELCLTVPVRLSSLLPYLPLLMDPLVCAMNGSPNLVTQGLRTLELCVDNLQPEYLLENMLPVRGALMQGLYRVISKAPDTASMKVAFRILGKFGGANRKLLNQPQLLQVRRFPDSYLNMEFSQMGLDGNHSLHLPISELMRVAADQMRYPADQIFNPNPTNIPSPHVKKCCMELSKAVLLAGLGSSGSHTVPTKDLPKVLKKLLTGFNVNQRTTEIYICPKENDREVYVNALLVVAYGIWNKDGLRQLYSRFFVKIIRQFALMGAIEFVSGNGWMQNADEEGALPLCLDSSVLVDALITCLSETSTSFFYGGIMCLRYINETLELALPDINQMSKVPLCKYLMEKVLKLCHGPAQYARAGGINAFMYMIEHYPRKFIMDFVIDVVDAIMEVLLGLVEEISSGSADIATDCFKKMMRTYFIQEENQEEENLTLASIFVAVFGKHYFHGNDRIREYMAQLMEYCMIQSRLETNLDKFYYRFREFFEPELIRIMETLPTMSLTDAQGSLDGLQRFVFICPEGFEFEKDSEIYKRYLVHLLDLAQTDTQTINQRNAFKKCETCPSHFLPPFPILHHIDQMRGSALQCLVIAYDRLRKQLENTTRDIEDEQLMSEILAMNSPRITVEQIFENNESWRRLMTVLLRAITDKDIPDIADKLYPALMRVTPVPTNIIATFGANYIRNISRANDENDPDRTITYHDCRKFSILVELNPKILVRNIVKNLANHIIKYNMSDSISNILVMPNEAKEEEVEAYEAEKKRGVRDLEMIGYTAKMLAGCSMEILTAEIIIDITRFAAKFEYTYSQDVLPNWIDDVVKLMNKAPVEVWKFFLLRESVANPARRSLIRRAIIFPTSEPLRKVFMQTPEYLERLIDSNLDNYDNSDERVIIDREMFLLSLVDRISRNCHDWLSDPSLSPIPQLRAFFNGTEFMDRYSVRSIMVEEAREIRVISMTEDKYKVPKLMTNIFLRYLRNNIQDYDMFFNVVSVFMGKFQTDFTFVREYLEVEVIPKMPLWWRREIFIKVMVMFEENAQKACKDFRILKALQYLILPSLQWAFERYDTDEIVGSAPIDDSENAADAESSNNTENLVGRLTSVIGAHRLDFSDGMIILFYQLCTLFVQHAPEHIHNNHCKKQGGRLRNFMLFAWPCLATPNRQDPTLRYTGFFFLANIIERFTINRKIVLQVFQQLMTNYQQDTRDQVRRAIDILTPALKVRMEDGHQQILTQVKKLLIEEGHILQHIQHILGTIIRNWRVYYHIRHEILTPLLNAVQRALTMPNSVIEQNSSAQTRKQAIEVCEMIIKWELLKLHKTDHIITDDEANEVDKLYEKLRGASSPDRYDFEDQQMKKDLLDSQRVITREHVDIVVNMLMRFCVMFHTSAQNNSTSGQQGAELVKKCQLLLRICLRSSVWGDFVNIRTSILNNYIVVPSELIPKQNEVQNPEYVLAANNSQYTIEMLNVIVPILPKPTLKNVLNILQPALIGVIQSSGHMSRGITQLISRLGERTSVSTNGLDEFELLNSYIVKYIHDSFSTILRNQNAPVLSVLGSFTLLRAMCGHEAGFLDNFMPTFLKVMDRVAREHLQFNSRQQPSVQKNLSELTCVCMELVRQRIDHIGLELKRTTITDVMTELIFKSTSERVIQVCAKLIGAMLSPTDMEFSLHTCLQQLVRIQSVIISKFKNCKEVITEFLVVVIKVFENAEYRNSEYGARLWEAFFWGLKSTDPTTRDSFSAVWEMTWPQMSTADICHRMKYIMKHQDWSKFKHAFWLKFALWGMLRAISKRPKSVNNPKKKVVMLNCATPWRTIEYAARLKEQHMETDPMIKLEEPEPMEVDQPKNAPAEEPKDNKLSLDDFLAGQQELLEEAAEFDFADALDTVSQITFGINDNGMTSRIWVTFFKSFWASLQPREVEDFTALIVPFLSSGVHNQFQTGVQDSVLAVWLEAIGEKVPLPSSLIEFISSKHECWYTGISILESSIWSIPKQLNNTLLGNINCDRSLTSNIETLESLGALYKELAEFDQYSAIWERRSVFPETMKAMSALQLGDMDTAASILEQAMNKEMEHLPVPTANDLDIPAAPPGPNDRQISPIYDREYEQWMQMYMSSCSELLQWQTVAEISNSREVQDVRGIITAASHIPDWNLVEDCRSMLSGCIPPDFHLEYTVFNLMSTVMRLNESVNVPHARERCKQALQECIEAHISRFRALPSVTSYGHVKILQSMNLVRDIEESMEVRIALLEQPTKMDQSLMMDMKSLMKVYRNRTPTTADDMGFVATWYDWRNQIHGMMLQRFEWFDKSSLSTTGNGNQSIVPIHSMAQAQLTVAKHAKSLGFNNLAKDLLNKLGGLPAIPMMDAVDKVCTYGKTLRALSNNVDDERSKQELLYEALEVLEDVRIDDLQKDQITSLLFNRATIHSALGQTANADRAFSAAVQLTDMKTANVPTGIKLFRQWGNHLNKLFFDQSQMVSKETSENFGRQALSCYFVAARVDGDLKARKPIAKILWIAKHLMASGASEALNRVIQKHLPSLNLFNWLYWIPQLVTEISHQPNNNFIMVLCRIAAAHPLQVFYHIREAVSVEDIDAVFAQDYTEEEMSMDTPDDEAFSNDPPFSRALKICLKYRPTDIRVLHRILKELDQMTETWVERHLRFAVAIKDHLFEDFAEQMDARFNEMQFSGAVYELTQKWKRQLEEDYKFFENNYNLDLLEIRNRRRVIVTKGYMGTVPSQIMFEKELSQVFTDPPEMKDEFEYVTEITKVIFDQLDIRSPQAPRPALFVRTVMEWIRIIRRRFDRLPRRVPMEISSPYLARFSHRTGCIEMPYDLLNVLRAKNHSLNATNQTGQYISMMSRFEPYFEIVMRGGQVTRKIYLRGQTGKSAAFYLKKSIKDERTNRVPQMFKHVDYLLQNDRETARRHLSVPSLLQMRVSKNTTFCEIASVQPYAIPQDCSRNYPASQIEVMHPYEVLTSTFNGLYSPDDMVMHFYERFADSCSSIGQPLPQNIDPSMASQPRLTEPHHVKNIIYEDFARDMIPFRLLTDYLLARYPDPVMFYAMRKQFIHSFAVLSIIEYHCNLSPMTPHQMIISMNTGVLNNPFYRFELGTGQLMDIEHFAHEVPFRLTPNLMMFVGVAQDGDLLWSMAAVARCLMKKEPGAVMRPLLWDEYANNVNYENMIYICHAANSYVKCIENKVAMTNRHDAKVKKDDCNSLIIRAKDSDNLSRMPPTYHAWF